MSVLIHFHFSHWEMKDVAEQFRIDSLRNFQVVNTSLKTKHLPMGFRNQVEHLHLIQFLFSLLSVCPEKVIRPLHTLYSERQQVFQSLCN